MILDSSEIPILYQDEWLVAIHKPAGMVVHRGWGRDAQVLVDIVQKQMHQKLFPIHRLDRGTSGVLVFGRSREAASALGKQWSQRQADKHYLALVRGVPPDFGLIDRPLPRVPEGPRVPSMTAFRRLAQGPHIGLVEAIPLTGRAHQIRRHLKGINHPILGDRKRGDGEQNRLAQARYGLQRLGLHAWMMAFEHPVTGGLLRLIAPLPADLLDVFAAIGFPPDSWEAVLQNPEEDWLLEHGYPKSELLASLAAQEAALSHPTPPPDDDLCDE